MRLVTAVQHVGEHDAAAGYDVASFSTDGSPIRVAVKASHQQGAPYQLTAVEWQAARRYGPPFWVYLVSQPSYQSPTITKVQDIARLVEIGQLILVPTAYQVLRGEVDA